jgi:hypothetical protein
MADRALKDNERRITAEGVARLEAAPVADEGQPAGRPKIVVDAYNGGPIRPGRPYLPYPLVIDLQGVSKPATGIALLLDHDPSAIVGQSTDVVISASNISVEGIPTGDLEDKEDPSGKVVMHAKNGFVWKASVDMEIERLEEVEAGSSVVVNGKAFAGPLFVVRAGKLDGVSLLSIGADRTTSAKIAARPAGVSAMEKDFHEWLTARKFDPTALEDVQRDTLLKQFQAEQEAAKVAATAPKTDGKQPDGFDDLLAPIRKEETRKSQIRAMVARFASEHPEQIDYIEAAGRAAITNKSTPEMLELEILRECRPRVNGTIRASGRDSGQLDAKVFEAGLCMAGKLADIEKHYDERTLEMADRKFRAGLGLGQLLIQAARTNSGEDFTTHRDVAALLRAAFPADGARSLRAAGPSTFDISGVLSNVANKFIVQHFMAVDTAWRGIAKIRPVTDFKAITGYSLNGDFQYDEIAPGGSLKHGTLGETAYSNQAKTFGKMFAIDRRDIINDDLNAFMEVAARLGRGGALKLNDVFWGIFLNNTAFFTDARGNNYGNAAAALGLSALEYAETLFMNQTDPDGKPIAVNPAILAVPPALKRTALRLMNSTEVRQHVGTTTAALTTDTAYGTSNTFAGDFAVVSSPYMSNSRYTGYSTSTWYLLANPNEMPVIEVCFLNGAERPTVESAQADFDTLGVKMRGYFDFGVALQEYRGGVRMALS